MYLTQHHSRIAVAAPAKLNLTLEVQGRRSDGFHELESLMVPVNLFDQLILEPADPAADVPLSLRVVNRIAHSGGGNSAVPSDDRNLVVRALRLFAERVGRELADRVTLVKRIACEAGMGGGSSDAAAALAAANCAWGTGWTSAQLAKLGAELGSDIPFFFAGGAAVCSGRGELVVAVPAPAGMPVVVIKPPTGLSTAAVFGRLDHHDFGATGATQAAASLLARGHWGDVARSAHNHLQKAACSLNGAVAGCLDLLRRLAIETPMMTGSGSACFAVCRTMREANRLAQIIRSQNCGAVYALQTCH
jgi:4-diphosphocytidyl-2-C-methyl-D-erythritol kinase